MLELMMIFQKKKSTVALVYESSKKNISENILDNLQDPKVWKGKTQGNGLNWRNKTKRIFFKKNYLKIIKC